MIDRSRTAFAFSVSTIAFAFLVSACRSDGIFAVDEFDSSKKEADDKAAFDGPPKTPLPSDDRPSLAPGLPDAAKCLVRNPEIAGLELEVRDDTVVITGPASLLARVEAYRERRQACASTVPPDFAIDWGDDPGQTRQESSGQPVDADGCPSLLSHRYTVEGAYSIAGYLYRSGAAGAPIPEWTARSQVTLVSLPRRTLGFELTSPAETTTLSWQKDLDVGWTWSPDRPLMIEVAAVVDVPTASGERTERVVASEVFCPTAYLGAGKTTLRFGASPAYEDALRNGPRSARIRTRVFDFDGILFDESSPPVTLSPEYVRATGPATAAVSARDAMLTFTSEHPDCAGFRIEWGDGLSEVREVPADTPCTAGAASVVRSHSYAAAGSYEIRIRSNDRSLGKPLARIVPYEKVTVAIP